MSTTTLFNAQQGHRVLTMVWERIKPRLIAGERLTLSISQERRNLAQNAKLHAVLTEIARQVEWAGRRWTVEEWKRLLTAAWMRTKHEAAVVVPAVDGQGFDVLYRHTSSLSKWEMSELLDYVCAWAAEHGIQPAED